MRVLFLLVLALSTSQGCYGNSDFGVHSNFVIVVYDENSKPIDNALISVSFEKDDPRRVDVSKTFSDANGKASVSGVSPRGKLYFSVSKDGYYRYSGKYEYTNSDFINTNLQIHEYKVVLRKIINPVPMYARNSINSEDGIELPIVGDEVGFDLVSYDWVAPFGLGTHADIYFKIEKEVIDRKNFKSKFSFRFPDQFGGIQIYRKNLSNSHGSAYPLPRMAPKDGYQNGFVFFMERTPGGKLTRRPNYIEDDINYIFRTRTVVENNILVKAMYGKFHGPIDFNPLHSGTARIYFKYYLNPDFTPNLEFDPKHNLFGQLGAKSKVDIK